MIRTVYFDWICNFTKTHEIRVNLNFHLWSLKEYRTWIKTAIWPRASLDCLARSFLTPYCFKNWLKVRKENSRTKWVQYKSKWMSCWLILWKVKKAYFFCRVVQHSQFPLILYLLTVEIKRWYCTECVLFYKYK